MRRGIWAGAAIAIAVVVAIPLWLVLDDGGERNQAALTDAPPTVLDCSLAKARGCEEFNTLLANLDRELAASARPASIEALQTAIQRDAFYNALSTVAELTEQQRLVLQRYLERQQQTMSTLSNISKKLQDTQQAIISNIKS
jgi:hypothetical protein